jgi:WD40 repeat protein
MSVLFSEPIIPLPEDEPRERTDTGVRFTQWGPTSDRLYSGSSDGIIKSWNVKRATEDVLIADVANLRSIVMSGAFSPDYSRLLVGDGKGGIHVLTTGMDDDDSVERMKFEPAEKVEEDSFEGCEEASRLVASGEIMICHGRPYQGPNYRTADVRRQALQEQLELIYKRIHEGQDSIDYNAMDRDPQGSAMEVDKSCHLDDYDIMDLS